MGALRFPLTSKPYKLDLSRARPNVYQTRRRIMQSLLSEIIAHKGGDIHAVSPEASVIDSVRKMTELGIGALLVMEGERLLGIFTERDVLVRVVGGNLDPEATRVAQVMTPDPQCVSTFLTVENAMHVISEKRFRHLPVLDGDRLAGMVAIGDLARWLARSQKGRLDDLIRAVETVTLR